MRRWINGSRNKPMSVNTRSTNGKRNVLNLFPEALATVGHHTSRKKSIHHTPGHARLFLAPQASCTFESSPSLTLLYLCGATRDGANSCIVLLPLLELSFLRQGLYSPCQGYKEYNGKGWKKGLDGFGTARK